MCDRTKLAVKMFNLAFAASMRLCMGLRRGFICRMKIGNVPVDPMTSSHTVRIRQCNTLGPSSDGQNYAIVHVMGYIKNWPPSGKLLQKQSIKHGTGRGRGLLPDWFPLFLRGGGKG